MTNANIRQGLIYNDKFNDDSVLQTKECFMQNKWIIFSPVNLNTVLFVYTANSSIFTTSGWRDLVERWEPLLKIDINTETTIVLVRYVLI